jgi:cytochrome b
MLSNQSPVKVWDLFVRLSHWFLLSVLVLTWYLRGQWHEWLGYLAVAIVSLRVLWGFVGSPYARFSQFVQSPKSTWQYGKQVIVGQEPRHIGHNPLGAWMILALLFNVLALGLTGWLYTTDRFWGVEWMERLHEGLANSLYLLAFVHVCGVLMASWRHRENLLTAMLHGKKRH